MADKEWLFEALVEKEVCVDVSVKYTCVTITWPSDVYVERTAEVEDENENAVVEGESLLEEEDDDAVVEEWDEVEREENCDVEEGKVEMLVREIGAMLLDEEVLLDVFTSDDDDDDEVDDDDKKLDSLVELAVDKLRLEVAS